MIMAADKQDKVLNVPTLRFPEFSGEWEKYKLGDIMEFTKVRISSSLLTAVNYVSTENMLQDFQGVTCAHNVPEDTNVMEYKQGDVLVSNIRPYLKKVWKADKDGGCSADVFVMRANRNVCTDDFLHHIVANDRFIGYVMNGAKGVKMPRGDKEQMKGFKTALPSLKEQQKVAHLLAIINERIITQIRIIDKLQSLMKGLNDYLQDFVPLSYSLSFSDIGEDYSGLSGKSAEDFGSGKPYITYVSIYANNFVEDDCCGKVSVKRDEKQNVVQKGDMLFTLSSETPEEVCYGAVYSGNSTETYLNSFCFGIRNTEGKVFSPYMAYFFNSNRFRREVYPLAQGSTRFNLQKSDFLQKHFSYPSIDDQHRIFEILNAYDNKLKVENQILVHYQHQKEFLLRNLFI